MIIENIKKQVTKNEYKEITKKAASMYWKGELNKQEFNQYLNSFDVLPFEINTNNTELKEVINSYCNTEEQKQYGILYKGFTDSHETIYTLKNKFNMLTLNDSYYSICLFNDDLKLIISYTEGDLFFSVCDTVEQYNQEKERTIDFYNDNY